MSDHKSIVIPLEEYHTLQSTVVQLQNELSWLKRQIFGSKSERFIPTNDQQTQIDFGIQQTEIQQTTQEISFTRSSTKKATGHSRQDIPSHLPFNDILIEPKMNIAGADKIGEEISWEFEYNPGTLFVTRYIRPKYVLPETSTIVIGELPARAIDKGNFGPGFMSTVTVDKYLYHLPLHRQRQKFRNEFKTEFAESTFCDLIKRTVFWLEPLYALQKEKLVKSTYIQADETPMPVLTQEKSGKTHRGFYWVYLDPVNKNVIFEYCTGRSREGPNKFLKNYSGVLQVDGYTGYDELALREDIARAPCMAHVRRKFEIALEDKRDINEYALRTIARWFEIEGEAKKHSLSFGQRTDMRQDIMVKEFADFKLWIMQSIPNHLPKSLTRKAMEYALGQWDGFDVFLNDGRVELSNNIIENAIRPVALGRKNYLFKGSEAAAQRGAIIYSILATAKLHSIEPREYIKTLLEKLPSEKSKNLDSYLPWNICRK